MIDALSFPNGIRLMLAWQADDAQAGVRLAEIFDEAVAGRFDSLFAAPAPTDRVHVSGPVDLLALTVMYRLFGVTAEHFYKHDAERFVRASLITQKLIGMSKHYISTFLNRVLYSLWSVFAWHRSGQTAIQSRQLGKRRNT